MTLLLRRLATVARVLTNALTMALVIGLAFGLAFGLPGSASAQIPAALKPMVTQAEKSGSTVIVISPPAAAASTPYEMSMTDRGLQLRQEVQRIASHVRELPERFEATLRAASPDGSFDWLLRAIATAVGGLLLGYIPTTLVRRRGHRHFLALYQEHPQSDADRIAYLLYRAALIAVNTALLFAVAMLVWLIFDPGHRESRQTSWVIISAVVIWRGLRGVVFLNIFAPDAPAYRLFHMSDAEAKRIYRDWTRVLAIGIAISAVAEWMARLQLDGDALKLSLIFSNAAAALLVGWLTWRHRKPTAAIILGESNACDLPLWRRWLASGWHELVFAYLVVAFFVSAYRVILDLPSATVLVGAPIAALFGGLACYGLACVVIDRAYFARRRVYERRARYARLMEQRSRLPPTDPMDTLPGEDDAETIEAMETAAPPTPAPAPPATPTAGTSPAPPPATSPAPVWQVPASPAQASPAPSSAALERPGAFEATPAPTPMAANVATAVTAAVTAAGPPAAPSAAPGAAPGAALSTEPSTAPPAAAADEPMPDTPIGDPVFVPMLKPLLENAAAILVAIFAIGFVLNAWDVTVGERGNPITGFLDSLLVIFFVWFLYRAVTSYVDHKLESEGVRPDAGGIVDPEEANGQSTSRVGTLLPLIRSVASAMIVAVGAMIMLSNLGLDVAPLFAGAGVIGLAVGFGAQALIRDIFSGGFFLYDDAFRKGEYIELGAIRGTVEKISLRSFQLRHQNGALHTVPFGEIKHLTNFSRDWVIMKLPLRVTYDTDVEKVRKLIKKLGQQLLEHPEVGKSFLQPLKSQGVIQMEDSAMIIRVKFMTRPGEQWLMRKIVYAAIQELFRREDIHFAHREVTVRLAEEPRRPLTPHERQAIAGAVRPIVDEEHAHEAMGGDDR